MNALGLGGRRRAPELPPLSPAKPPIPRRVSRLKVTDRCDGDRHERAVVAAEIFGVDLYFCKHHFERFEVGIRAIATEILDERWILDYEAAIAREVA